MIFGASDTNSLLAILWVTILIGLFKFWGLPDRIKESNNLKKFELKRRGISPTELRAAMKKMID